MVGAGGQGRRAGATDPPERMLDPDAAVGGSGPANRPAGVGPDRPEAEACCDRDGRSAGGQAGPALRIPGIAGRLEGRMIRREGKFRHGVLAQYHRADMTQPLCDMGVARSEEHTSELQSLMRTSYAVYCLKKKNT